MADEFMLPPWPQVYSWGCNSSGQLGLGDFVDRRAPAHIEGLWALPVASLAAGDSHSAALTANGCLFAWGANEKARRGRPRAAEAAAQVQRTASERQRARRVVNQRFLTAMLEMGIPLDKAELALSETGNVGVEVRLPHSNAPSGALTHDSAYLWFTLAACRLTLACIVGMVKSFRGSHHDHSDLRNSRLPRTDELLRQALPLAGCTPQARMLLCRWRLSGCSASRTTSCTSTSPLTPTRPWQRWPPRKTTGSSPLAESASRYDPSPADESPEQC